MHITDFKCFEDLQLDLANLNVLAGVNSMGKSSAIQALLLLRQSFEMGSLDKGIHLNGPIVQIGTGYNLMNRNSNLEKVTIKLDVGSDNLFWSFSYDKNSDFQKNEADPVDENTLLACNLFKPTFSFVSADRMGPKRFYEKSYHEIYEKNQVGIRGELYADYLAERGLQDKIGTEGVKHPYVANTTLLYQTEAWLSEISPGVHLNAKTHQEAGIVELEYAVSAEKYSPINVGFGLSYVAPIILALLKAEKGDLVILENPEAHLHPKGQRKMGELISRAAAEGVQIVLETHSDHVLNGIRLSVKQNIISKDVVKLNYFYKDIEKNPVLGERNIYKKCSPVILESGSISDWPDGFFDEWDKALIELL